MKNFTVRYVGDDGNIRRMTVEAENEEEAEYNALMENMGDYSGSAINKIIDVMEE